MLCTLKIEPPHIFPARPEKYAFRRIKATPGKWSGIYKEKRFYTIKTTTKEARQNIRQYILDHFAPCGYDFSGPCSFPNVARFILSVHAEEKAYSPEYQSRKGYTNEQVFIDWAQGLPSVLDTCYYYNRSAVDDLGAILEQSEREKAQYSEQQAEQMLTHLIYRELKRGAAEK